MISVLVGGILKNKMTKDYSYEFRFKPYKWGIRIDWLRHEFERLHSFDLLFHFEFGICLDPSSFSRNKYLVLSFEFLSFNKPYGEMVKHFYRKLVKKYDER